MTDAARALEYVIAGTFQHAHEGDTWGVCARCAEVVLLGPNHDYYNCADNNNNIENKLFHKASEKIKKEATSTQGQ